MTKTRTTARTWTTNRASIKASIRYLMHRPTMEGERGRRELFTNAGETLSKVDAYQLINEARERTKFVRIVLSPDPRREDTRRDLHMQKLTIATISALQNRLKIPVRFIASLHDDHTDKRHVHIIALVNRSLSIRDFQAMREAATQGALRQRRLLDRTLKLAITKTMQTEAKHRGVVTARHEARTGKSQTIPVPGGDTPACPRAGMEVHPVATIKPGLYWCRTCHDVIPEAKFRLTSKQRGRELELQQ